VAYVPTPSSKPVDRNGPSPSSSVPTSAPSTTAWLPICTLLLPYRTKPSTLGARFKGANEVATVAVRSGASALHPPNKEMAASVSVTVRRIGSSFQHLETCSPGPPAKLWPHFAPSSRHSSFVHIDLVGQPRTWLLKTDGAWPQDFGDRPYEGTPIGHHRGQSAHRFAGKRNCYTHLTDSMRPQRVELSVSVLWANGNWHSLPPRVDFECFAEALPESRHRSNNTSPSVVESMQHV